LWCSKYSIPTFIEGKIIEGKTYLITVFPIFLESEPEFLNFKKITDDPDLWKISFLGELSAFVR